MGLIFGVPALHIPPLGALGAGIGTSASIWVGTLAYALAGCKHAHTKGFTTAFLSKDELGVLCAQALPSSATSVLFASGMTAMYAIVSHLGTAQVAAVNVLLNLALVLILPISGMGIAAGALAGRALGRGDVEDAKRWPWDVSKLAAALMAGVGLCMAAFPLFFLTPFLSDPVAASLAVTPLRLTVRTTKWRLCDHPYMHAYVHTDSVHHPPSRRVVSHLVCMCVFV